MLPPSQASTPILLLSSTGAWWVSSAATAAPHQSLPCPRIIGMLASGDGAKIARELVYNLKIYKPGLYLFAITAARQISRDAAIRQAMRNL